MLTVEPAKRKTAKQVLDVLHNPSARPKHFRREKNKGKRRAGRAKFERRDSEKKIPQRVRGTPWRDSSTIYILLVLSFPVAILAWYINYPIYM
jgi:hypothetical protein